VLAGVTVAGVALVAFLSWSGRAPLARARRVLGRGSETDDPHGTDRPDAPAAAAVSDDGAAATEGEPTATTEEVPTEFLSDEEVVFTLLDDHDGRMRQADIVEETDWSKSKVSRVLSAMEDEERIVKVDVGRGNVVMRPEDLPPGAESAFDN